MQVWRMSPMFMISYGRTSMTGTDLGPWKIVLAKGSSSHPGWHIHKMTFRDHNDSSSQLRWMSHQSSSHWSSTVYFFWQKFDCFEWLFRSSLIWVCPVCQGLFGRQLVSEILELFFKLCILSWPYLFLLKNWCHFNKHVVFFDIKWIFYIFIK